MQEWLEIPYFRYNVVLSWNIYVSPMLLICSLVNNNDIQVEMSVRNGPLWAQHNSERFQEAAGV